MELGSCNILPGKDRYEIRSKSKAKGDEDGTGMDFLAISLARNNSRSDF